MGNERAGWNSVFGPEHTNILAKTFHPTLPWLRTKELPQRAGAGEAGRVHGHHSGADQATLSADAWVLLEEARDQGVLSQR